MNTDEYFRRIKNYITDMPSLPVSENKIGEVCNNRKSSPSDIYKLIIFDPVLIAKVMRLFNSVYWDLSENVTSFVRAIIVLGINTIKNLVINSSAMNSISRKSNLHIDNASKFWNHSFCVAAVAKAIALKTGKGNNEAEEYFMAGMLHDIGKIPMLVCFSEQYKIVADRCRVEDTLIEAEEKVFGFDHCAIGKMIIEEWGLGEKMGSIIENHHDPKLAAENKYWEIVYVISIANYFINKMRFGFDDVLVIPPAEVFEKTGITEDMLEDVKGIILSELEKAKKFLNFEG